MCIRDRLFPRDCGGLVLDIQKGLLEKTGKQIEVMVYGDGAVSYTHLDVYKRQMNIIGNGVALDIPKLIAEIKSVTDNGVPAPHIICLLYTSDGTCHP